MPQGTNTLVISGLTAGTTYNRIFTFTTQYSTGNSGFSSATRTFTTQSNLVTDVVAAVDTSDTVTISWTPPEDSTDYSGVMISADSTVGDLTTTPQSVSQGTNTFTISGLTAATTYMPDLTIATQYTGSKSGGSDVYMVSFTTQSNLVTNIEGSDLTSDSATISWTDPVDTVDYSGVMITVDSDIGSLTGTDTVSRGTNTFTISDLTANTLYTRTFTVTTQYTGGKSGGNQEYMVSFTTQSNLLTGVVVNAITADSVTLTWSIRKIPQTIPAYLLRLPPPSLP